MTTQDHRTLITFCKVRIEVVFFVDQMIDRCRVITQDLLPRFREGGCTSAPVAVAALMPEGSSGPLVAP